MGDYDAATECVSAVVTAECRQTVDVTVVGQRSAPAPSPQASLTPGAPCLLSTLETTKCDNRFQTLLPNVASKRCWIHFKLRPYTGVDPLARNNGELFLATVGRCRLTPA